MSAPDITEEDVRAVTEVVRSGRLALGPKAEAFENALAAYVGARHAVAVSSGTAALHLALLGLGIGPGDEVLVPSYTFAASVNAVLYVGATPVFVDIEPATYCMDVADAERRITPRTRCVLAVDVFGHPADWPALEALADSHGLALLDDSCEALGAECSGRKVGSFGNASTFAFYPNKQITTGEGGMLVTDDERLADAARSYRNQGRSSTGAWLEHERLGYNYRLDEISAALGVSQLARLESILERRARVAARYSALLADVRDVTVPLVASWARVSWFVYVIRLAPEVDRLGLVNALADRGVPTRTYFSALHVQPYIEQRLGSLRGTLPVTEAVAARTLALPFHTNMPEGDLERVVDALRHALEVTE
jgi:perosamine synthetase